MIEKYFKDYTDKYHEMKKALKEYIDAKQNFYTLTGINYDDMPKAQSKNLGIDDLMVRVETLMERYIEKCNEYELAKEKCKKDIERLDNPIHKAIIEYAYLNFEDNKKLANSLKEYHNKDYSLGYIPILKLRVIEKFEKMIIKYNLI